MSPEIFGEKSEEEKKLKDSGEQQEALEKKSKEVSESRARAMVESPDWINKVKANIENKNQEKAKPSTTESTETKKETPKPKQEKPEESKKKAPESPEGEPSSAKETVSQSAEKKTSQIPSVGPVISGAFEKGAQKAESGGGSKEN